MMHDDEHSNANAPEESGHDETENSADARLVSEAEVETDDATESSLIEAFTAGGRLRAAREARGKSIEDMARELLINRRVLESLEQTIQPPDYDMRRTRIVARSYANALGIPADAILADFPMEEEQDLATAIPKSSVTVSERGRRRFLIPALGASALVVAIGASVVLLKPEQVFERRTAPSVAERVVAVNTAQESLFAKEPVATTANEQSELSIAAVKPAWIEVRGADGTIFRSRTMGRGEVYYPRVGASWTVTVQDGTAFEWRLDDISVGLLSETAEPIYSASIDEAATLAREHATPAIASTSNSRPSR
ncbi:helix-turn-helix domain-containing protein [Henriciella sp. AS95]|uniref:helix-turn-helix domain-containing protein n=1 Tax=Henriciella sp. AS95 TaxID=3135782 RepID=UPI00317E214E